MASINDKRRLGGGKGREGQAGTNDKKRSETRSRWRKWTRRCVTRCIIRQLKFHTLKSRQKKKTSTQSYMEKIVSHRRKP